nr:CoA transferase [Xylophilus sp. ASV27]
MERLGPGPDACLQTKPRLVCGRMAVWGRDGPLAQAPGHDVNYISLTGTLHAMGRAGEAPATPLNLMGAFGNCSLYLALGVLSALLEARSSGQGQVVDAAMVDGTTSLMTLLYGFLAAGYWKDERGANRLDSGAPWYTVYETQGGKHVSIAANETRFYREALGVMGLKKEDLPGHQHDQAGWPYMKQRIADVFKTRTRDEWVRLAAGTQS